MSYSYNFNFDFEDFDDILDFFDNSFPFQEFARIMAIALIVAGTVAVTVALACYIMQSIAIHRQAKTASRLPADFMLPKSTMTELRALPSTMTVCSALSKSWTH